MVQTKVSNVISTAIKCPREISELVADYHWLEYDNRRHKFHMRMTFHYIIPHIDTYKGWFACGMSMNLISLFIEGKDYSKIVDLFSNLPMKDPKIKWLIDFYLTLQRWSVEQSKVDGVFQYLHMSFWINNRRFINDAIKCEDNIMNILNERKVKTTYQKIRSFMNDNIHDIIGNSIKYLMSINDFIDSITYEGKVRPLALPKKTDKHQVLIMNNYNIEQQFDFMGLNKFISASK